MSVASNIVDSTGGKYGACVTKDNEVCTIPAPYPPLAEQKVEPLRQYFTLDGTPGGDNDMGIDGSSTNVDFCIPADTEKDRYITSMNFLVAYAAAAKPYLWADGAALTNGTRIFYTRTSGEKEIHDGIKNNQDMFRLSFSLIQNNWEIRHTNALNDYGYFISTDLTKMGLPFGIKLDRGSNQKLNITVRDDATAAVTFNCIGYGFERFE